MPFHVVLKTCAVPGCSPQMPEHYFMTVCCGHTPDEVRRHGAWIDMADHKGKPSKGFTQADVDASIARHTH
jgi:hypothetical protein